MAGGQFKLKGAARCGRRSGNSIPCRPNLPGHDGMWMVRATRGDCQRGARPYGRHPPIKPPSPLLLPPSSLPPSLPPPSKTAHHQISTWLSAEELVRRSDAATSDGRSTWQAGRAGSSTAHPGCVERRSRFASMAHPNTCEFDGRVSLVRFGKLRLYARANPATHGQRFVQTAASTDDGATWGRFSFINMDEYEAATGDVTSLPSHAILSTRPAPSSPSSPAHKFRGCIAIAVCATCAGQRRHLPSLRRPRRTRCPSPRAGPHPRGRAWRSTYENAGRDEHITPTAAQMAQFPYLKLPRPRLVRPCRRARCARGPSGARRHADALSAVLNGSYANYSTKTSKPCTVP